MQYMYPAIIKKIGGKQKTLAIIKEQMDNIAAQGFQIVAFRVGKPSPIIEADNGEWQAVIPQHNTIKKGEEEFTTNGALIAISSDKGRKWTFIDVAGNKSGTLRKMYPNISKKLSIPENTE